MKWSSDPQVVYVLGHPQVGTGGSIDSTGFLSGPLSGSEQKFAEPEGMSGPLSGSENVSAQKSGRFPHAAHAAILGRGESVPVYDPRRVHAEFPERWRAYVRANYRDLHHVCQVFAVSERTARKWWNGETGANGGHVAIAMAEHPIAAPRMLFAAE